MNAKEAAERLNGSEYRNEGSKELFAKMKNAGLVAVFGASDDLMEFRGAIYDEVGCYDGGTACLDENGLLRNECDNEDCPHFARLKKSARTIKAIWSPDEPECSWIYETDIPHETFDVMEDGELYCRGIVFRLADARGGGRGS